MKLYMKCLRNGSLSFSCHEGMSESLLRVLLEELGGTSISLSSEEEFLESKAE